MMSGNVPISRAVSRAPARSLRDARAGHVEADLEHRVLEKLAVLALGDGLGVGPDEPDVVLLQDAAVVEVHRGVERRLAAEGGQEASGFRRR